MAIVIVISIIIVTFCHFLLCFRATLSYHVCTYRLLLNCNIALHKALLTFLYIMRISLYKYQMSDRFRGNENPPSLHISLHKHQLFNLTTQPYPATQRHRPTFGIEEVLNICCYCQNSTLNKRLTKK